MSFLYLAFSLIDPQKNNLPHTAASNDTLQKALTLTYVVVGAIALMLVVIAGFRYVISAGDATKMAETRRMIIYTAVGLIVVASAATLVTAVLGQIK